MAHQNAVKFPFLCILLSDHLIKVTHFLMRQHLSHGEVIFLMRKHLSLAQQLSCGKAAFLILNNNHN